MNRLLIVASALALLFAVTTGAAALLGFKINDLVVFIATVAMATIACVLFMTLTAGIGLSIVAFVLGRLIRTRLGNVKWLRLLTRAALYAQYEPPMLMLYAIILASTVLSVHFVCQISPAIATSPGLPADIALSAIFWFVAEQLERFAQK